MAGRLSDETLESLLIALNNATDDAGVPVEISPLEAFQPLILDEIERALHENTVRVESGNSRRAPASVQTYF